MSDSNPSGGFKIHFQRTNAARHDGHHVIFGGPRATCWLNTGYELFRRAASG